MRAIWTRLALTIALGLSCAVVWAPPARADAPLPVTGAGNRTLLGNPGGAIDTYGFNVPQPTRAAAVTVTFTPAAVANASLAGFNVYLNGTPVGSGASTATPGTLSYTLPPSPSGVAVVQVFSYSGAPTSFTIQVAGAPSGLGNGPAANNESADRAAAINGSLSENLAGSTSGSFAYFTFPSSGASPPTTVSLTYSPADAQVNQAVGLNVLDSYGNTIGSAIQPANQNQATATLTLDLSRSPGEPLTVQVFNYAPGVQITYHLSVSGIAPVPSAPASPSAPAPAGSPSPASSAGFRPFWVENFVVTPIWSGPDGGAVSFGQQPQFSGFLVVQPQSGSRLYVFNPRTNNYAYIDAAAVGPSGPPS